MLFLSSSILLQGQECDPDTEGPTVICINGLVVSLETLEPPQDVNLDGTLDSSSAEIWALDFIVLGPDATRDNCSENLDFRIEIMENTLEGEVPEDDSIIFTNQDEGIHLVRVWGGDEAQNWRICETYVIVQEDFSCTQDNTAPEASCRGIIDVSLGEDGTPTTVAAVDVDNGSTDNCALDLSFLLALAEGDGTAQTSLEFSTVGTYVVELTAIDQKNNKNTCEAFVRVSDSEGNGPDCSNDLLSPIAKCSQNQVFTITTISNPLVLTGAFLAGQSVDDCTTDLTFKIEEGPGGEGIPNASFLSFDETQANLRQVTVWVIDDQGNYDKCTTEINIMSDFIRHSVEGKVLVADENCETDAQSGGIGGIGVRLSLKVNGISRLSRVITTSTNGFSNRYFDLIYEYTPTKIGFGFGPNAIEYEEGDKIDVEVQLWENINTSCSNSKLYEDITGSNSNLYEDFGIHLDSPCPELYLDVSTPFLRRCFETIYWVNYCNYGGANAKDSEIEINFDDFLEVVDSSIPWDNVDGQTYTFNVGDIPSGDCDRFFIKVKTSCDSELGQTHCTEAKITNSTDCSGDSVFEGPELELKARCEGEEVKFEIRNIGLDMTESHHYIVIEDILMLQDGQTDVLLSGEKQEFTLPANGSTFRLEVDQVDAYPWAKISGISLEGCGENEQGDFSRGFVTQFAESDWRPDISIDCQENIGAFDPNDKQAFPKGVGIDKITKANTEIEYMIRFQNTGTDTAFTVRIEDQLSELLKISTVRPGASSHPYSFSIKDNRMMEFRFDNILLPDSTTNLEASNGFVKFSVQQVADNPIGSLIENTAGIYFDFNEPVITNTVQHLIGEPLVSSNQEPERALLKANIIPNPFTESTIIQLENLEDQPLQLVLFDYLGRKIRTENWRANQHVLHRKGLASGIYFFTIRGRKGLVSEGRLIIQ